MPNMILYNPGIYNNRLTGPVPSQKLPNGKLKPFPFLNSEWENLLPNEMKSYPDAVAREMRKRWPFLESVKESDVRTYKDRIRQEKARMERLKAGVKEKELSSGEKKELDSVPEAVGREVKTKLVKGKHVRLNEEGDLPEAYEGEEDHSMLIRRPGMAGVFGAA